SGNSQSCITQVTIIDTIRPFIVCKSITVALDSTGNASITGLDIDVGSADNCTSGDSLAYSAFPNTFTCADIGVNNVTLTVTDSSGNSQSCITQVTIIDTIRPFIVCKSITVALDSTGNASITGLDIDGGSADNCTSGDSLAYSAFPNTFTCADIGVNNVTLRSTECRVSSESSITQVTIIDTLRHFI